VGKLAQKASHQKAVEKWTEEHCPLFHSHCDYEGGGSVGLGGLIQTAGGRSNGLGSPLTKRLGCEHKRFARPTGGPGAPDLSDHNGHLPELGAQFPSDDVPGCTTEEVSAPSPGISQTPKRWG